MEPTIETQQEEAQAPANRQGQLWVAGALVVGILLGGLVGFFIGRGSLTSSGGSEAVQEQARLAAAYETCRRADVGPTLELADGGTTIVIDTGSEYGDPAGMDCVLRELRTPQSIQAEMGRTTAMMGVQRAESDGIEYSWSYHPDNGVNMVISNTAAGAE